MALTRDTVFWTAFERHADLAVRASRALVAMLENPQERQRYSDEVNSLENQGDAITHEVVAALHQTWITPLDREEIHALITGLDDVLDYIEAASDWVALYELDQSRPEAVALARVLVKATVDVEKAIKILQKNVADNARALLDLCVAINDHEHEADGEFRRGIAALFKDRVDPLDVMRWRDVFEAIETATDRAEDVANIIEGIVLEHS